MSPSDTVAAIAPVVAKLESLGVSYYLGGSVASSSHGIPRSTLDVDLVADLAPKHVAPLVEALQRDYYISRPAVSDAIARRSCFNIIHSATSFKVDIFTVKNREYDRVALGRIQRRPLDEDDPSTQFYFASPEDIILSKLEWYRLGDEVSDSQWSDVIGVMRVQQDALDRSYLNKWAAELGVADLLEKAWSQAEG
jgi:hypothetical protein